MLLWSAMCANTVGLWNITLFQNRICGRHSLSRLSERHQTVER
jgi:hypothetical protein